MLDRPNARETGLLTVTVMLSISLLTTSCGRLSGKDDAKCTQALGVARTALKNEQLELVRQWRAYAYRHCGKASDLSALDQEIRAKQTEIAQRKVKNQRAAQIAQLFVRFAGQHMTSPRGQCFAQGHPDRGWCTRSQGVSGSSATLDVKYNQHEPDWVRFDTLVEGEVTCADMNATEVRAWSVTQTTGGVAKRTRCSLTTGALRGFSALISVEANGTRVSIFSSKEISRDARLRRQLESEGK